MQVKMNFLKSDLSDCLPHGSVLHATPLHWLLKTQRDAKRVTY